MDTASLSRFVLVYFVWWKRQCGAIGIYPIIGGSGLGLNSSYMVVA
jgi:hypothetical protein